MSTEIKPVRGQRLGNFVCKFCDKSFRYIKAFNTHIKQHKKGEISRSGNKRRYILKKKKVVPDTEAVGYDEPLEEEEEEEEEDQPPYDSLSPYGSPAHFEQPMREDSPDLGMMMLNNFHNGDNGTNESSPKLRRGRPKIVRTLSPEIEQPAKRPVLTPSTSSGPKGRGRPRKDQTARDQPEMEEEPSPFADFCEVDVNSMLKKSIFETDSFSQSGPSANRSRSRSASVELIDDIDIFGSVLPDNANPLKIKTTKSTPSSTTFECTEGDCSKKFHLRANLKKHLREAHGSI